MITKQCIAVAEDDRDEVFLLRWAFKQAGLDHEFFELHDGEATIEYLGGTPPYDERFRYPLPRLLILDLKMPNRNALVALARMASPPHLQPPPQRHRTSS